MINAVIPISYFIAAAALALAGGLVAVSRAQRRYKALVVCACVATSLWAAAIAAGDLAMSWADEFQLAVPFLELLRSALWIATAAFVLFVAYRKRIDPKLGLGLLAATACAMLYIGGVAAYAISGGTMTGALVRSVYTAHVLIAVGALVFIENLFRNSGIQARWTVKFLCIGLGVLFGYDFIIYAEASLFGQLDPALYAARGIVNALAVPFIVLAAARAEEWPRDLQISRSLVFYSATLLVAGAYLVGIAAVAYSLRALNGPWAVVTQVSFLAAGILVLAVVSSSGGVQARFKEFIGRSFFRYKYDYRQEWLRFIAAVSDNLNDLTSSERIVRAIANIVGSTSAAIWVREEDGCYGLQSGWNMVGIPQHVSADDPLIRTMGEQAGIWNIRAGTLDGAEQPAALFPQWLQDHPRALLALPLVHGGNTVGIVVLGELRAPRALDWEDYDLLKTVARQAASYVAEEGAAKSLAIARRFEELNRRFAFTIHDIKNLSGQMTLILRNAERHGDNPEFQKDMMKTIGSAVERLRSMMEQLQSKRVVTAPDVNLDLADLIRRRADAWKLQIPSLHLGLPTEAVPVIGKPERLDAVLDHVLQNALDAAGPAGKIAIDLHVEGRGVASAAGTAPAVERKSWAIIMISDNGPGMERHFIETQLFQPMVSVKRNGFGIGAFQARQFIREMGGRLEVQSTVGKGTQMVICLPLAVSAADAARDEAPRVAETNVKYG